MKRAVCSQADRTGKAACTGLKVHAAFPVERHPEVWYNEKNRTAVIGVCGFAGFMPAVWGWKIENKGLRLEKAFAASAGFSFGSCMDSHNRPSAGNALYDMADFSHTK